MWAVEPVILKHAPDLVFAVAAWHWLPALGRGSGERSGVQGAAALAGSAGAPYFVSEFV